MVKRCLLLAFTPHAGAAAHRAKQVRHANLSVGREFLQERTQQPRGFEVVASGQQARVEILLLIYCTSKIQTSATQATGGAVAVAAAVGSNSLPDICYINLDLSLSPSFVLQL